MNMSSVFFNVLETIMDPSIKACMSAPKITVYRSRDEYFEDPYTYYEIGKYIFVSSKVWVLLKGGTWENKIDTRANIALEDLQRQYEESMARLGLEGIKKSCNNEMQVTLDKLNMHAHIACTN